MCLSRLEIVKLQRALKLVTNARELIAQTSINSGENYLAHAQHKLAGDIAYYAKLAQK